MSGEQHGEVHQESGQVRHREIDAGTGRRHPDHVASRLAQAREIDDRTGFAKPNRNGACIASRIPGNTRVPKGSTCLAGLKLTRPARFAVSSPSFQATHPWAASCSVIAVTAGSTQIEAEYNNVEMCSST